MIAKNEEAVIGRCLDSVRELVSEMILVDTGSTDRTVEIAKSFGAKVLFEAWQDDFSAPRNISLKEASSDWILVLDADEGIAREDHDEIRKLTLDKRYCYEFLQRHYSDDYRLSDFKPCRGEYKNWEAGHGGYFESNLVRLFPNREGIHYKGAVHELVEHSIRELGRHKIIRTRVPIHHYGHTKSAKKKNKAPTYTLLGETKIIERPEDWKNHFELAVEHNNNSRHEESLKSFINAIALNPTYVPSWLNMGYVLCEMGKYEEALESLDTALKLDPKCEEAFCNMGVTYLRQGKHAEAAKCFLRAIELKKNYVNAYLNLGRAMWSLGNAREAIDAFLRAIDLLPNCAVAKADLGTVLYACGKLEASEKYLKEAIAEDPELNRAHYYLSKVYEATKETKQRVS